MAAATHLTPDADVACGPPCGGPSELREARPEGWYEIGAGMASHWSFVHDGWTIAFPKEHIQGDLDDFLRKVIRLPASYYTSTRRFYPKVSA